MADLSGIPRDPTTDLRTRRALQRLAQNDLKTLTADQFGEQAANVFIAGPTSGSADSPTFRLIVLADIPDAALGTGSSITTKYLRGDRTWQTITAGSVTSVAMTVPSFLSVSGSPITTSGTLAIALATEVKNTFFCGPSTGADATPTFRVLATADLGSGTATGNYTFLKGDLTWTNVFAFLTTKGDVLVYNAAPLRLAVGSEGQALIASNDFANSVGYRGVEIPLQCLSTTVANSGTSETDLMTTSLPASFCSTTASSITIEMAFTFAANANNKTVKVYLGTDVLYNSGAVAQNGGAMSVRIRIVRTGGSAGRAIIEVLMSTGSTMVSDTQVFTTTQSWAGAITIKGTGTSGTASSDITQQLLYLGLCNR